MKSQKKLRYEVMEKDMKGSEVMKTLGGHHYVKGA